MLRRSAWLLTLLVSVAVLITLATTQETKGGRYDQQIQEDIERVLQSNPRFQNVHATTEDAVVTLSGTVKLVIDKLDDDRRAHPIKQVGGVRNEIAGVGKIYDDVQITEVADEV